jgi:cytochrome c biogenesis protein CcdA
VFHEAIAAAVKVSSINWPVIIGAGIIDSINPCAFGVLIFLLAYLNKVFPKHPGKMVMHGVVYTLGVFVTYLAAGLILLPIIQSVSRAWSVLVYEIIGVLIILAGLIEIKDFFWYGKGFSLAIFPSEAERIKIQVQRVGKKLVTAFTLGIFVALVELPCTGAVYLAVLALMSLSGFTTDNLLFLVAYNIIFVLPLLIIIALMYYGTTAEDFHAWKEKHKGLMRLLAGLLLIALGAWMILFVI